MQVLDWVVIALYFLVMVGIGWWSKRRIHDAADFFVAGGKIPWWLVGISHHMSGYSAAVFVAYAALAYTTGFAVYVWWALSITVACTIGAFIFAPRWPRLRQRLGIISPLEYLKIRFNIPTQQVLAWSGAALKIFDVAAKWAASAILLQVFADIPLVVGILLVGGVTMIYSTIGGIWADVLTDFGQFIIQLVAAVAMLVAIMIRLGAGAPFTMWDKLPEGHALPFNGTLTMAFFGVYIVISTLSYNGGTWNLAMRMIATPNGTQARRSMLFSGALYLVWPLILFLPMWAAPLILPDLADPEQSYAMLAKTLLPQGLVGLVLAGMFAHTMAMTASDANAISSVVVRDIIPVFRKQRAKLVSKTELAVGRATTFTFIVLSMAIALGADNFGGVIGLIVTWFGALVGPIAVPMLLGLLPWFKRSGSIAALVSWAVGLTVFAITKYAIADQIKAAGADASALAVGAPVICSIIVFVVLGLILREQNPAGDALIDQLSEDVEDQVTTGGDEKAAQPA